MGGTFQEKLAGQNTTPTDVGVVFCHTDRLVKGQKWLKRYQTALELAILCMNHIVNYQLKTNKSEKVVKPDKTGEKLVGQSFKLVGQLPTKLS